MIPSRDDEDEAIERLELQVGRLLHAGVWVASACLATGLALWMMAGPDRVSGLLLTGGLIVLMLTPLARVIASLVAYVRLRDWFFAGTTLLVLGVLVAAWLLKA
jgi:uncharacterized membrane protein